MRTSVKKISIILISASFLFSESAFAARIGKSRNSGMQRSVNTTNVNNGGVNKGTNTAAGAQPAGQPQRQGAGVGTVVAGAAAGALGGYMLGKAMSGNASDAHSSVAGQDQGSQIPWGTIAILGALLGIGLMMFRRRTGNPAYSQQQGTNNTQFQNQNNANFEIPQVRNSNGAYAPGQYTNQAPVNNSQQSQPVVQTIDKLPDGVETQYFLRQAKGMFLHIQSMNTLENVTEVEKYMTPELYADVRASITENDYVADFSQLDCKLLDATTENATYIASVLFFGKVSESPSTPVVDYKEVWNFVKPTGSTNAKWIVAGIQQADNLVN